MGIELTEEQRRVLDVERDPLRVIDPRTNAVYVLVREEVYERVKSLLDDDFDPKEAYPAIDRAFAEGWDDPKLDDYDRDEDA